VVLSDGTTLIRGLLRRSPTDPSLTDSTILQHWNMCRREVWSDLSGTESQTVILDAVADEANYMLGLWTPERVLSVSVLDATGLPARQLQRLSVPTLLSYFPAYPDSGGITYPQVYQVRLWASVVGLREIWDDPWGTSEKAQTLGYCVNLWPTPTTSIQSGINVEMVGAAGPLSDTAPISELPVEIDEAAAYLAAVRLSPTLGYDPSTAMWMPELRRQAEDVLNRAKRWRANFGGGIKRLHPQGFGNKPIYSFIEPYASVSATPTTVVTYTSTTTSYAEGVRWKYTDTTPTANSSTVSFDLTALGLPSIHADHTTECRIISQDLGEIFNVTVTGTTVVTGTLRSGFTFDTGDTCRLWYPIES